MADFKKALATTANNEGGYANNPADKGGETYAGISRKNWPSWVGWQFVDKAKLTAKTPHDINVSLSHTTISTLVEQFYKTNFWDVNRLDQINDQQIANTAYDCGVNCGTGVAARMMQKAAGVVADGIVGSKTIAAVNEDEPKVVYHSVNAQRSDYYHRIATGSQAQFLHSWLSRLVPYDVSKQA